MEPGSVFRDDCAFCLKKKLVVVVYVSKEDVYTLLCKKCLQKLRDEIVAFEAS